MADTDLGNVERRQFAQIARTLTDQQYAQFAVLQIQRLSPIYRFFFSKEQLDEDVVRVLAAGSRASRDEAEFVRAKIESSIEGLYESDDMDYPMDVLKVLAAALHRLAPRDGDTPEEIGYNAQDAAASARSEDVDRAVQEEARWQLDAVRATSSSSPSPAPASLSAPAVWVTEFLADNA